MKLSTCFSCVSLAGLLVLTGCPGQPKAPSIVAFSASSAEVHRGEAVTLTWEARDATSVNLTQVGVGTLLEGPAATGNHEVTIVADTTFLLTVSSTLGNTAQAVVVRLHGSSDVVFSALPADITAGEAATLLWNAPGATSATLTRGGQPLPLPGKPSSGSLLVRPSFTTTYAFETGGTKKEATVTVRPAILSFTAGGPARPGQPLELFWTAGGASKLTISAAGRGPLTTVTDAASIAAGSFTDTIPTTVTAGALLTYTLTLEAGTVQGSKNLELLAGVDPRFLQVAVSPYAKAQGFFDVAWMTTGADRLIVRLDGVDVFDAPNQARVNQHVVSLPSPTKKVNLELVATNAAGGRTSVTRTVEPVGPATLVEFKADKTTIASGGEAVTLSWNVTNARRVRVEVLGRHSVHEATGQVETGSVVVYPNGATTYTLLADNWAGGAIAPQPIAITVTSPAKLTFSPEPLAIGATTQVTGHTLSSGDVLGLPVAAKNAAGDAFVDISETGLPIPLTADNSNALVSFGSPFLVNLYGVPTALSGISVSINGWFSLSNSTLSAVDDNVLPIRAWLHPLAIAPYWEDLLPSPYGSVTYQLDGEGPARRLIVQWTKVTLDGRPTSELTFQAQVHASGKIVFAYPRLGGANPTVASIGVVNADESDTLTLPSTPAEGDVFTLFGKATLPVPLTIGTAPYTARLGVGSGFLEIDAQPQLLPLYEVYVSEANPRPAAAVTNGEWLELANRGASPFDLNGWTLDFGGGSTYTFSSAVLIPANGVLLLGQSANAGDGLTIGHVYGPSYSMPDGNGQVRLVRYGGAYASFTYGPTTLGPTAGIAVRADPPRHDMLYAASIVQNTCLASQSYGTQGQLGTPGTRDPLCVPYALERLSTSNFEAIATSGTALSLANADEAFAAITLPAPFVYGGTSYPTVYANTNGFLIFKALTCPSASSCYYSNRSTLYTTSEPFPTIAPFWDDLEAPSATTGMYWQAKDPNGTPGDGDEYLIVSYEGMHVAIDSTSSLDFQVKLFANRNIEFHYGALSSTGDYARGLSATSWLESPDSNSAFRINTNSASPGISPNSAYRFRYAP